MTETMIVIIDGEEQQRSIDHVEVQRDRGGRRHMPAKPIPYLREGEWMTETVDGMFHIYTIGKPAN